MKKQNLELITNIIYILLQRKLVDFNLIYKTSLRYFRNYKNINRLKKAIINYILGSYLRTSDKVHYLRHIDAITKAIVPYIAKYLQFYRLISIRFFFYKLYIKYIQLIYIYPAKGIHYFYTVDVSIITILQQYLSTLSFRPLSILFIKYYKDIPYVIPRGSYFIEAFIIFKLINHLAFKQVWQISLPNSTYILSYLFIYLRTRLINKDIRAIHLYLSMTMSNEYHPTIYTLGGKRSHILHRAMSIVDKARIINKACIALNIILANEFYSLNEQCFLYIELSTTNDILFQTISLPMLIKEQETTYSLPEDDTYDFQIL